MISTTAARVTWLLPDPEKREAYDAKRPKDATGELGECMRCGSLVWATGAGQRAPLIVSVRDRGTDWQNKETLHIHRGCIPKAGERPQRIRARSLAASQVRASVGDKGND